ncbi:MAG: ABC transporter permease [Defluviitaleaceae bacterium]|nr:ABC transporter permease [Defluviitaleaceae bacterium]
MPKFFFMKLAVSNLRKNAKLNVPFAITMIGTVAVFYLLTSLAFRPSIIEMSRTTAILLELSSQVAAVFSGIFLFYTHSFLMKRRKMEFGLYNVLGLGKAHIARIILIETAVIVFVSVNIGLAIGLLLDRFMYLLLLRLMGGLVTLGFEVSLRGLVSTPIVFTIIFGLILADSLRQVFFSKPIELLRGGRTGEKEPQAKWFLAILGVLLLGIGYGMAITVDIASAEIIIVFFMATLFVIGGTFLLFTTSSIALLKILRKNKRYYYKARNFISLSSMIYRMKQNAAGLAVICILSTSVLVMVASAVTLYAGLEDGLGRRFPHDISLDTHYEGHIELLREIAHDVLEERNLMPLNAFQFSYFTTWAISQNDVLNIDVSGDDFNNIGQMRYVMVLNLEDYNHWAGTSIELEENEVLFHAGRGSFSHESVELMGSRFYIREQVEYILGWDVIGTLVVGTYFIVVQNRTVMDSLLEYHPANISYDPVHVRYRYGFDIGADSAITLAASQAIVQEIRRVYPYAYRFSCHETGRMEETKMYGGIYFIGMFLGALFLMATVLTIYYKQIIEGFADKERYIIMKNIGLDPVEIKRAIHTQILIVFFLPLITAGVHLMAAFPALTNILAMLDLQNINLFILCTVACFAIFAVIYTIIYILTARTYYKIVG